MCIRRGTPATCDTRNSVTYMTDEYRAPQPYDDGPRYDDDRASAPAADQSASTDEQQRVFAMPAGDEASNTQAPQPTVQESAHDSVPASAPESAPAGQDASSQQVASEQRGFESAQPQQDARLREAVQRSRHLPLDGDYEVGQSQSAQDASQSVNDGGAVPPAGAAAAAAQPAPSATEAAAEPQRAEPQPTRPQPTAAQPTEPQPTEQPRRTEPAPAAAAADAQPRQDASATADPQAAAAGEVSDDEKFAPLGISMTEGLLIKPEKPSNRGFAVLMSVFATVLFAAGYAAAFTFARKLFSPDLNILDGFMQLVGSMQFYLPVAVFFVVFLFWSLLANRARWWGYVVASQVIAVLVAVSCYAAVGLNAVLGGAPFTVDVFLQALRDYVHLPGALLAALVAIPVVTWFGGISAMRGRKLTREYEQELAEYERRVEFEREQARDQRETTPAE